MGSVIEMSDSARVMGRIAVATYEFRDEWKGLSKKALLKEMLQVQPDESTTVDNVMCVNGLGLLVQALNWSGVEDQNANMGSPFSTTYLAPLYGAVGTGNTAVVDTDTQLTAESTNSPRTTVTAGATQNASHLNPSAVSWSFIFGLPVSGSTVVAEAGLFGQATSVANSGQIIDHALISPTVTQGPTQLMTLIVTLSFGN